METVSFVIPCYRSQETLGSVVQEIADTMGGLPAYRYEIVLVNDCSPDGTFSEIQSLAEHFPCIVGVDLARNFGQHAALMAGFRQARGDIIVCLDDDGQTPADEVGKLLEKLQQGYDVVYASYTNKQHSGFRNWGSRVNSKMTEVMLGKPKDLAVTSYFAMRRFVMAEMLRYEHCYPYVIGLVLRTTQKICNVEVHHRARAVGTSGYTLRKLLTLWMNGFTSFSVKPLRMATYFGAVTAGCGFLYLLYIVARYFVDHTAPMGWSSTMAILLLLGGVILLVLGLIGEYVGRIFMCVNAAPQYVVRQIVTSERQESIT
ncbi:glycosyltransferase family 2 protein [Oscillibacter sp.]|uniref:glycosyltransferase family 2 protein n=1 Tax=Oscillibacter sp. TaxID=1945593 RepID=UPI001B67D024|nr:glycosyltransferase family 2 protein [Oscillibacter sp.]MBP3509424.1 glycosyltransferase family 2 protein [Oscillibacter sp.]